MLATNTDLTNLSFVEILLEEQQHTTAVEKFAQLRARAELPLQARYYRDLIPAQQSRPGEQYAFDALSWHHW